MVGIGNPNRDGRNAQLNGRSYHRQSDPKNVHKEPRNENYFENDHIFFEIDQLQGNLQLNLPFKGFSPLLEHQLYFNRFKGIARGGGGPLIKKVFFTCQQYLSLHSWQWKQAKTENVYGIDHFPCEMSSHKATETIKLNLLIAEIY